MHTYFSKEKSADHYAVGVFLDHACRLHCNIGAYQDHVPSPLSNYLIHGQTFPQHHRRPHRDYTRNQLKKFMKWSPKRYSLKPNPLKTLKSSVKLQRSNSFKKRRKRSIISEQCKLCQHN